MKVLKSGVEMTPEEMQKTKGAMCACGCGIGVNSSSPFTGGSHGGDCFCACEPGDDLHNANTWFSASRHIWVW